MENGVLFQYFEWNLPNDGQLWKQLKEDASHLQETGITAVWIPPAYKARKQDDQGYGAYDLYDLGEFDQKNTIRTKYGTKQELQEMIHALHQCGISVYLDAVMNHKAGADYTEKFRIREMQAQNRNQPASEPYEIEGWTGFDFPGRKNQYSDFKWHWYHFTGVDFNQANQKTAVYEILGDGKSWSKNVDTENGNYDYLMFADIDYNHPDTVEEMKKWGLWVSEELNLDGMRLDAIKHIDNQFIKHFLEAIREKRGDQFFAVGEYWKDDDQTLNTYLAYTGYGVSLFDIPLHCNLYQASLQGKAYDMRNLLQDSLVSEHPELAVTFIDNHDSQKNSSLESQIRNWFKPLAYGLILLMKEGYPCIFYGDYYSIHRKGSPHRQILDLLLSARKKYAHGEQQNYFDHPNTVGFVRLGDSRYPESGLAFLMSNGEDSDKVMQVGAHRQGEIWYDITGNCLEEVVINAEGNGKFGVSGGKLAVWVKRN